MIETKMIVDQQKVMKKRSREQSLTKNAIEDTGNAYLE